MKAIAAAASTSAPYRIPTGDVAAILCGVLNPVPLLPVSVPTRVEEPEYEEEELEMGVSFEMLVIVLANEFTHPDHERRAVRLAEMSMPMAQRYLDLVRVHRSERVASLEECMNGRRVRFNIEEILLDREGRS